MAENPATWTPLEKAIHEAIRQHDKGIRQGKIGWSLVKQIAEYLKAEGWVFEKKNRPR